MCRLVKDFGRDADSDRMCKGWIEKFEAGDFDLNDKPCSWAAISDRWRYCQYHHRAILFGQYRRLQKILILSNKPFRTIFGSMKNALFLSLPKRAEFSGRDNI